MKYIKFPNKKNLLSCFELLALMSAAEENVTKLSLPVTAVLGIYLHKFKMHSQKPK